VQSLTHLNAIFLTLAIIFGFVVACVCLLLVLHGWQREVNRREQEEGLGGRGFEMVPRKKELPLPGRAPSLAPRARAASKTSPLPDPLSRHPETADVAITPDAFAPADEKTGPVLEVSSCYYT
jgi:hypothetical protein